MVPTLQQRREAHAHYAAACVGGFLGLYPVVSVARLFGSAQTANLIEVLLSAFSWNLKTLFFHAVGAALYCGAIFLATLLPKRTKCNLKLFAMVVDMLAALCMWRLPHGLPALVYLYPTFFAMPFQWCAFKGAYGFVSATIFSSNNLRMFVSALTERYCNKDKTFALKARFFGATLFFFHCGVALSYVCWRMFGSSGFLCAALPIAVCGILSL